MCVGLGLLLSLSKLGSSMLFPFWLASLLDSAFFCCCLAFLAWLVLPSEGSSQASPSPAEPSRAQAEPSQVNQSPRPHLGKKQHPPANSSSQPQGSKLETPPKNRRSSTIYYVLCIPHLRLYILYFMLKMIYCTAVYFTRLCVVMLCLIFPGYVSEHRRTLKFETSTRPKLPLNLSPSSS